MFNISRLLNTDTGRLLISILLGLGLAALFRGKCVDRKCIKFKGPVIDRITGKIYRFNDSECSKFNLVPVRHDDTKKTVDLPATPEQGTPEHEQDIAEEEEPFTPIYKNIAHYSNYSKYTPSTMPSTTLSTDAFKNKKEPSTNKDYSLKEAHTK